MAYIVVGSAPNLVPTDVVDSLYNLSTPDHPYVYCYQRSDTVVGDSTCWVKYSLDSDPLTAAVVCDAGDIHSALNTLGDLDLQQVPHLTLIWFFQPSDCEREELQGAVLRACICHNSRVVTVLNDTLYSTSLADCWICDYTSPVITSDVNSIITPVWRGSLILKTEADSIHIPTEVSNRDTEDQTQPFPSCYSSVKGQPQSYLEMVSPVDISSIHRCMLADSYTLTLVSADHVDSLNLEHNCGYVVRMVQALYSPPKPADNTEQKLACSKITTTEAWMTFVLRGYLPKTADLPTGPVNYKYYLLCQESNSRPGNYLLHQFDTTRLTHCIDQLERSSRIGSGGQWSYSEDTQSIFNTVRTNPLSPTSLNTDYNRLRDKLTSYVSSESMYQHLHKPEEWPERLALQDCLRRRETLKKTGCVMERRSKNETGQSAKCQLTLDSVRSHFQANGQAKNPELHLPEGSQEKTGLREYTWPQARLHYGPGICYADDKDCTSRLADPRLIMYRDKHNFPETASLFTTDVMPSIGATHGQSRTGKKTSSQSASGKQTRSQSQSTRKMGSQPADSKSVKQKTDVHEPCRQSPRRKGLQIRHPPAKRRSHERPSSQVKEKLLLCEDSKRACGNTSTSGAQTMLRDSAFNSRQQKAERNKKNEQRMRAAVHRALSKNGIKRNHKSYEAYTQELFLLSMRGVRKLKTSIDLEKKMREIATAYAPAAILTINQSDDS